jgi:L-2,4-diaminobutyrate decarboxylase
VAARLARDVVADANRLCHPMYLGHQVSAPLPAAGVDRGAGRRPQPERGRVGDVAHRHGGRDAGGALDGRPRGLGPRAGGTFTSGGTEATFAALLAARSRAVPDVWTDGLGADPPVIVCGVARALRPWGRAAGEMGLGQRNVVTVASRDYRMDPEALGQGAGRPRCVGAAGDGRRATAGSTATGSFDDLNPWPTGGESRGLWLHVEGAHGASALLSGTIVTGWTAWRGRTRSRGTRTRCSSCRSARRGARARGALAGGGVSRRRGADLFHEAPPGGAGRGHATALADAEEFDAAPRVWDQGVRSFQCSRRADALKAWVAFQRYGADGLGALYDRLCATAARLHERLAARAEFEVLHAPESNILCFRYVGERGGADPAAVDALNARVRARYNASGAGWITTTVLGQRRVLRVTVMNPRTTDPHLAALVDGLAAVGRRASDEARPGADERDWPT